MGGGDVLRNGFLSVKVTVAEPAGVFCRHGRIEDLFICSKEFFFRNGYQTRPTWSPKGNKRGPNDANIGPKSSLRAFDFRFFYVECFVNICKHDHGALVRRTCLKGTSLDKFFLFVEKLEKLVSGTCRSYLSRS